MKMKFELGEEVNIIVTDFNNNYYLINLEEHINGQINDTYNLINLQKNINRNFMVFGIQMRRLVIFN